LTLEAGARSGAPDPLIHPAVYRGVACKRVLAYMADVAILALIMAAATLLVVIAGIVTFGLLTPLLWALWALIPLCYHITLLGGPRHATLGMRLFGLELVSLTAPRPDYVQAAVHTVLFYLSLSTAWLILIVALFNPMRRTLHDYVAGTVIVNRAAMLAAQSP
jgi:uncharacterized RDD family membrane protein YckC